MFEKKVSNCKMSQEVVDVGDGASHRVSSIFINRTVEVAKVARKDVCDEMFEVDVVPRRTSSLSGERCLAGWSNQLRL